MIFDFEITGKICQVNLMLVAMRSWANVTSSFDSLFLSKMAEVEFCVVNFSILC